MSRKVTDVMEEIREGRVAARVLMKHAAEALGGPDPADGLMRVC